ncbi:hypothetical protein Acor_15070 [Acrocarpospora corrugata]|uniref:Uncharacterized protein n=1 Tax=Acrocarpospora corrugata TaxID=35763 RepID=A0A5M3VSF3_9ACTN|nr:hypothetical protein [Acrocarpospora corrugata]GER99443.1 hypothetical protein Acor_15070 [Acrocarpospora corrugata]
MKLRGERIFRLTHAVLGLGLIILALEWVRITLALNPPFHLAEALQTPPENLISAAFLALPLLALGGPLLVRAPIVGITCTAKTIKTHGFYRTRSIKTSNVTGIRRGTLGRADLCWDDERGWPHRTRIAAFSVLRLRRVPAWIEEHNTRCLDDLENWIDQHK